MLKCKQQRSIVTFNARTLLSPHLREELTRMSSKHNYDIVGIQEHRIVHKDGEGEIHYEKQEYGYTLVTASAERNTAQAAVRGVGLLLSKHARESLAEVTKISERIIKAEFSGNPATTIIVAYSPTLPCGNTSEKKLQEEKVDKFYQGLEDAVKQIPAHNILMIVGDFNARIGTGEAKYTYHQETNGNGNKLLEFVQANSLVIGNTQFQKRPGKLWTHTNQGTGTKSQLDYILICRKWRGCLQNVEAYSSLSSVGSDHRALVSKVKLRLRAKAKKASNILYDWDKLIQDPELSKNYTVEIKNRFNCLREETPPESITEEYKFLITANKDTAEKLLPRKKRDKKLLASENERVSKARELLQQASKRYNTEPTPENKTALEDKKSNLEEAYIEANQSYIESVTASVKQAAVEGKTSTVWKAINDLTGRKKGRESQLNGRTQEERVTNWYNAFQKLLGQPPTVTDEDEEIEQIYGELPIRTDDFDKEELEKALKQIRNGKSSGEDGIPGEVIKGCDLSDTILHFCNAALANGDRPDQWNHANIIPIPKSGDLTNPNNYRGISLTSTIGKTYNRMILNRIRDHIDPLLRKNQNGFRKNRGTIGQILVIRRIIEGIRARKLPAVMTFVDFRKAFDSIHRGKMCKILSAYGIPLKIVSAIEDMYSSTWAKVISPDGETEAFEIKAGVLQGDTLAPFIFIVVLDYCLRHAIPEERARDNGFTVQPRQSSRIGKKTITDTDFADDLALLSDTLEQAEELLLALEEEAAKVGLMINAKKTQYMSFNQQKDTALKTRNGSTLEEVKDFKYLGSWVASSEKDLKTRKALAWQASNKMGTIWKSALPRKIKINLFLATIEPILIYGAETWTLTKNLAVKLDGCYTRLLRAALNISWQSHTPNEVVYGDLPKVTEKVRQRRLRAAGHYHRHKEEIAEEVLFWEPKHGKPGARNKTYVQQLREDTGLDNNKEVQAAMEDRKLWRANFLQQPREKCIAGQLGKSRLRPTE